MNSKELKKRKKDVEVLLSEFGFIDPDRDILQLKAIFDVEDKDINVSGIFEKGGKVYEVHYKDVVISLVIRNYEFKIVNIVEYDDMI